MKKMITADRARFESGAQAYAAYLEKPEGRLRLDAFANLQEFLPQDQRPIMRSGCRRRYWGYGVRLGRLGCNVTLLDSSREMLQISPIASKTFCSGSSGRSR